MEFTMGSPFPLKNTHDLFEKRVISNDVISQLNTSNLRSDIYLLNISEGNFKTTKKLVVNLRENLKII